jgi:HSP20 family protein
MEAKMANIIRWDPIREIVSMRDDLDRAFEDFFNKSPSRFEGFGIVDLDVYQTKENIVVKASIPGAKANDIDISVVGDVLTISGDVKQDEEIKEANYHIKERRYGSFSRSISLPAQVISDKATAEFENGVLHLILPKAEVIKPKMITVKAK